MSLTYSSFFSLENGTVKGVGRNTLGQLGIGSTADQTTLQDIPITGVKQIACGIYHTVFLLEDGTVKSVGYNSSGQLGIGNATSQTTLQSVPVTGVKQIACGYYHTIFLLEDGTVKSVGQNNYGQLGIGNTTNQATLQSIPVTGVKQIACGAFYTIFLLEDGTVKSVGRNDYGQLGIGSTADQTTLQSIPVTNVKQIACGYSHTIFLLEDGTVKSVGYNGNGQLGIGSTADQTTLQSIPVTNVKQIACGSYYAIFLLEDGTVKSVGQNNYGQLGIGNTTNQATLQSIPIAGVKQISCGMSHTIFLLEDGTVKSVGKNDYGQLGIGNTTNQTTLQDVPVANVKTLWEWIIEIIFANKYLFQDGEDIKKWIPESSPTYSYQSVVPVMTSANSPEGVVTASSQDSDGVSSGPAWNVFDKKETTYFYTKSQGGYVQYQFSSPKKVNRYKVQHANTSYGNYSLKSWKVEAYVNGAWVKVDEQTGQTAFSQYEARYFDISNPVESDIYRFTSTAGQNVSNVRIGEIDYYEAVSNNDGIAAHWETIGSSPATKEMFDTNGMDDLSLITNESIQQFISDAPQLLCWTDETDASRTTNLTAIPHPQLLLPIGDIEVKELEKVVLSSSLAGEGDLKILISGDNGVTWNGKTLVDIANLENIKANGFTTEEFNTLTAQELTTFIPNGKARFAFYLEQENIEDVIQVNSLTIGERIYTMTPSIESLAVLYGLLKYKQPTLFVSRDSGVTWKEVTQDALTNISDLPEGTELKVKAVLSSGQELYGLSYSWI